jgi:hypothetical protein
VGAYRDCCDSKLLVSLGVGKRKQAQTQIVGNDVKSRLRPGHSPEIFTDAYAGFESSLLGAFGRRYHTIEPLCHGPCISAGHVVSWRFFIRHTERRERRESLEEIKQCGRGC